MSMSTKKGFLETRFGPLGFETQDGRLVSLSFVSTMETSDDDDTVSMVLVQLSEYVDKTRQVFDLPVSFIGGTPFQQAVWQALLDIPYGKTATYQAIADKIGRPKTTRAVGQACKRNPVALVIPCHRVIGKDGSMTGYGGKAGTALKRQLLDFEQHP
ncbi:MAG: methylated-DNA--[protein]-cysteine S-methyltransferase [Acholeplasmataceae bacterium]|nr:MAG: methylated-DNA--[protein]-cysteine S-methyltransferase [Acholeplasmataceae bacterium]